MEIKEIEKELKRCEKKMMGHLKNNEKDELVAEIKCLFISHMNYIEELHSHDLRKVSSLELLQELKRRIEDGKIDIEHFVPEDDFYAVHGLRIGKQSLDLDMLLFKYRQKKDIERAFHDKDYLLGNDLEDTRKELPRKDGEELGQFEKDGAKLSPEEGEKKKNANLSYRMNVSIERSRPIVKEEKWEEI